jgi:N-glycosylase/DNA lyase
MKVLIRSIEELKNSETKKVVDSRIKEFTALGKKSEDDIFKELCFCILTANFNAERGIKIQDAIGDGFLNLSEEQLAKKLKELGHRFPSARAKYISEARRHLGSLKGKDRDWIVDNIKGLGYKEASHFLRNTGHGDYAIIDFHILDLLERHGIIKRPRTLTKNKYLEIENTLREMAKSSGLNLAELDLYLWYQETGKILK